MKIFDTLISARDLQAARVEHAARVAQAPTGQPASLVILDCRATLGDAAAGPAAWADGHIPFAVHANLELDLAAPAHSAGPTGGGRHPLPERADFAACCSRWGIGDNTQVVVYDDAGGAYAARAWWLLRWVGHAAVAVLDGGLAAWQQLPDGQLTRAQQTIEPSHFTPRDPLTRIASLSEVEALVAGRGAAKLLGARPPQSFDGDFEPIDPVAGHIPGATCFSHSGNIGPDGLFLPPAQLAQRFNAIAAGGAELICYCGSGVTAAHNVLAIKLAGLPEPKLYVGSWSEWCADPARC